MPLLARTVATPLAVIIRAGAVRGLAPLLADVRVSGSGSVAVAVGSGLGAEIASLVEEILPNAPIFHVEGGSLRSTQELSGRLRGRSFDALVGIGGGGTIDVAKYAASMVGLPYVAVATTLSHDGLASPVSVLEEDGRKASFGVHIPLAVIVDLDFVARSSLRHVRAGIGDAISNLSAVADWHMAADLRGEQIDGYGKHCREVRSLSRTPDRLHCLPEHTSGSASPQWLGDGGGWQQPTLLRWLPRDFARHRCPVLRFCASWRTSSRRDTVCLFPERRCESRSDRSLLPSSRCTALTR